MNKKNILLGLFVGLLLVGSIFVTANLDEDKQEVRTEESPEEICGSQSCGGVCGGSCGIPRCGCGR